MEKTVRLSVLIITYNHEKYIAQALESALMQEVDFYYEIVVGEDCSTDATVEIVRDFADRFPEKIRLLATERNLGVFENFVRTLNACRGEYVALLEGDDYWTDKDKLQKQVAYLDEYQEFSLCFHDAVHYFEDCSQLPRIHSQRFMKDQYTLVDLLTPKSIWINTCTVVFRNSPHFYLPEWIKNLKIADFPLIILNAERGNLGYIQEAMATYRRHSGGIWSPLDYYTRKKFITEMYDAVDKHLNHRYANLIKLHRRYLDLSNLALQHHDKRRALVYLGYALINYRFNDTRFIFSWGKSVLRILRSAVRSDRKSA